MAEHFNGLTPAEAERLAMLAEEAGEVIQVVGKILRHGYDSHHPNDPTTTNRDLLLKEVEDFCTIVARMEIDQDFLRGVHDAGSIWENKLRFAHHQ